MHRESEHPWPPLTIMAWLRFDAIRRAVDRVAPSSVVELGCGEGALATWLAARAAYTGVEPDDAARAVADRRLADRASARVLASLADVEPAAADLGCAFEVLEHIEDDAAALVGLTATVRPGGAVLLSVPAHPARFGASDELVGHHRRYARSDLLRLLAAAGLTAEHVESYGAGAGQLLDRVQDVLAARRLRASTGREVGTAGSGRYRQPGSPVAAVLRAGVAAPARLVQVPFRRGDHGVGYVVLARRREA